MQKERKWQLISMNNVLLDQLPEEWESPSGEIYELDTDFRIGIQICLIQNDPELSSFEKSVQMQKLMFVDKIPKSPDDLQDCIHFFISGWSHDKQSGKKEEKRLMDFDIDQWRIYSAFLQYYRIDLNEIEYMHWWMFMGLLACLPECAYTKVIDIRHREVNSKMSKEDQRALKDAKEIYDLDKIMSREDQEIYDNMYDFLGGTQSESEKRRIEEFEKYAD